MVQLTPRFTLRPESVAVGRARVLSLSMDLFFEVVPAVGSGWWRVATVGYRYTLGDNEGRELVSYQWHPGGAAR